MNGYVVALYGSAARKDSDEESDYDVLIVGSEPDPLLIPKSEGLSVSRYSWEEMERLRSSGSLFLWHIRKEGKVLAADSAGRKAFQNVLQGLERYKFTQRNLDDFQKSLEDVSNSIALGDTSLEFEAAALGTIMRHSSILGCYLVGFPQFGRYSSLFHFCRIRGLPSDINVEFAKIYSYRMAFARNLPMPPEPLPEEILRWLGYANLVIKEVSLCSQEALHSVE